MHHINLLLNVFLTQDTSGVKNLAIAAGKGVATAALVGAAPESAGLTLAAAAYTGSSAAGNGVAGITQLTAAAFGSSEDLERANCAAEAVTTLTTVSGLGTAIVTGGDMKAASRVASVEGFVTTLAMPEGGMITSAFGRGVERVGGTIDKVDTAVSTTNAVCDPASCD